MGELEKFSVTHKHKNIFSHHFPTLDDDFVPKSEDAGIFFWKFPSHNKTQPLISSHKTGHSETGSFFPSPPKNTLCIFSLHKRGSSLKNGRFLQHWFMKKKPKENEKPSSNPSFLGKHVLGVQKCRFFLGGVRNGKKSHFQQGNRPTVIQSPYYGVHPLPWSG